VKTLLDLHNAVLEHL
jgi:hypothetical protein